MLYRWDLSYCLNMPAKTFFAMLKVGRELEQTKRYLSLADMSDLTAIPIYTPEYHQKLREYYLLNAYPESKVEIKKENVFDGADPKAFQHFISMMGRS